MKLEENNKTKEWCLSTLIIIGIRLSHTVMRTDDTNDLYIPTKQITQEPI